MVDEFHARWWQEDKNLSPEQAREVLIGPGMTHIEFWRQYLLPGNGVLLTVEEREEIERIVAWWILVGTG